MDDKYYKKMSSIKNLELAWMRLKTGQNLQYKNYYRSIFLAYDIAREHNLRNLSERLLGGSFKPSSVLKFYIPKSSGLQRPITFLHLDDLIIYQAFTNVVAERFLRRRAFLEYKYVFSSIQNKNVKNSIYFLDKWQFGYIKFIKRIKQYFNDGYKYVAHFDLAAYFDTIDHNVLVKFIAKETYLDFGKFISICFEDWSVEKGNKLHHGIPQGPVSSNYLADVYMLPIDEQMSKKGIKYVRYVDDIKIYGVNKEEVLYGVLILDKECKEKGLIPHSKKYEIIEALSIADAIGKYPSMSHAEKNLILKNESDTAKIFIESIDKNTYDISKVKYILKAVKKNDKILDCYLKSIRLYPELTDEFVMFVMNNYIDDVSIGKKIVETIILNPSPYEYVEGKYWELISYFLFSKQFKMFLINEAIKRLKKTRNNHALQKGLLIFLSSMKEGWILKWVTHTYKSLIQMMILPYVVECCKTDDDYENLLKFYLGSSRYEPAILLLKEMLNKQKEYIFSREIKPLKDQSGVINNILGMTDRLDPIGQILSTRYKIKYSNIFNSFFSSGYINANRLIYLADNAFYLDKNSWVNYTDSFNDIFIRYFITLLNKKQPTIRWPKLNDNKNEPVNYGSLLDKGNQFSIIYPSIRRGFFILHARRHRTPTSHAFDKKTLDIARSVTKQEQRKLFVELQKSYSEIILEIERLI